MLVKVEEDLFVEVEIIENVEHMVDCILKEEVEDELATYCMQGVKF